MHLNIFKKKANQSMKELSMREKKHQANLRKNSGLHFQIGLIATLFVVFGIFQLKFEKKELAVSTVSLSEDIIEELPFDNYVIEEVKKIEEVVKIEPKLPKDPTNFVEVPNENPIEETPRDIEPVVVNKAPKVGDIDVVDVPDEVTPVPVNLVQVLPMFPGCEKFSDKKKQMECFSKKIAKHINRKFDSDVAAENGITGKQRINVAFVINDKGEVVDVQARAAHPALQKEAMNAVNSLPKMKPAKQGYKKVPVRYALPITFQVSE